MASAGDKEVTREDQEMINKFGLLHSRLKEYEAEYDRLKKELDTIHDAQGDVMMAPEEPGALKIAVGESFFDAELDVVIEKLEEEEGTVQAAMDAMDKKICDIKGSLDELKAILYGKFGRSAINLDD